MATDLGKPVTTDLYTQILQDIRDNFDMLVRMQPTESVTDAPTGSIAYDEVNDRFIKKTGPATWVAAIPNGGLSNSGLVQLTGSYTLDSNTLVPTAAALRNAYNDLDAAMPNSFADLTGAATAGQVPNLESLNGACTAGQVPALSALSGSLNSSQINYTAAPANHLRTGNRYVLDGTQTTTGFDVDANVTESLWESIGPTGSGANNIMADMDSIPAGASAVILMAYVSVTAVAGTGSCLLYGTREFGSLAAFDVSSQLASVESDGTAAVRVEAVVPLDANLRFQVRWDASLDSARAVTLNYKGFIID